MIKCFQPRSQDLFTLRPIALQNEGDLGARLLYKSTLCRRNLENASLFLRLGLTVETSVLKLLLRSVHGSNMYVFVHGSFPDTLFNENL